MTSPKKDTLCVCKDPNCQIQRGLCHCGCESVTPLRKWAPGKGKPHKFMRGHQYQATGKFEEAMPFKIDGVYCRLIPLGRGRKARARGLYTIVNADRYADLVRWSWFSIRNLHTHYVRRSYADQNGIRHVIPMQTQILQVGEGFQVDHKNGNGLDNRDGNLRRADFKQQRWNTKRGSNNSSGHKGVCWEQRTEKWIAYIMVRSEQIFLGRYVEREKAIHARKDAEKRYFGEFVRGS